MSLGITRYENDINSRFIDIGNEVKNVFVEYEDRDKKNIVVSRTHFINTLQKNINDINIKIQEQTINIIKLASANQSYDDELIELSELNQDREDLINCSLTLPSLDELISEIKEDITNLESTQLQKQQTNKYRFYTENDKIFVYQQRLQILAYANAFFYKSEAMCELEEPTYTYPRVYVPRLKPVVSVDSKPQPQPQLQQKLKLKQNIFSTVTKSSTSIQAPPKPIPTTIKQETEQFSTWVPEKSASVTQIGTETKPIKKFKPRLDTVKKADGKEAEGGGSLNTTSSNAYSTLVSSLKSKGISNQDISATRFYDDDTTRSMISQYLDGLETDKSSKKRDECRSQLFSSLKNDLA